MSPQLVPSNPEATMVIRDVVPGSITTLSVPFLRFGKIKFGGRATIVKLSSGALAVFSPVALTPTVRQKIASLSSLPDPVAYVAAPDMEHHLFLSEWAAAYPRAKFLAPEGLAEKRSKVVAAASADSSSSRSGSAGGSGPSITIIPFHTIFTRAQKQAAGPEGITNLVGPDFDADLSYEYVDAHPNKELVFFHRPSATLIEADLLFNLPATEQYSRAAETSPPVGTGSPLLNRVAGALQSTAGAMTGQKRVLWYLFSRADRKGWNRSVARIHGWGIRNLIPCHGDVIMGEGGAVFAKAMEWHLKAAEQERRE